MIFSKNKTLYWTIFAIALIFLAVLQYYGLFKYHYVVPAGDDPVNHYNMAKAFYDGKTDFLKAWSTGGYPPLYHMSMAWLAHVFNIDLLQVINWTYPAIIIFASISIFICAYVLFGPTEALISFLVYAFTGKSNIQLLMDGGYPNLIAAHILLPLFVLFYIKSFTGKKEVFIPLTLISGLLIILTHHISSFYLFGIVGITLPILIISYWLKNAWGTQKGVLSLIIVAAIYTLTIVAFFSTDLFQPIRSLYIYGMNNFDSSGFWSLPAYPIGIGITIFLLGLIGACILLIKSIQKFKNDLSAATIVLGGWLILLFAGSRIHVANPERLARDMIVPLSITAGFGLIAMANLIKIKWLKYLILLICIAIGGYQINNRLHKAIRYEPMIRHTSADEEVMKVIGAGSQMVMMNQMDYFAPSLYPEKTFSYDFDPTIAPANANKFQFIIISTEHNAWLPGTFRQGAYENMAQLNFQKIGTFESPINKLDLYEKNIQ